MLLIMEYFLFLAKFRLPSEHKHNKKHYKFSLIFYATWCDSSGLSIDISIEEDEKKIIKKIN